LASGFGEEGGDLLTVGLLSENGYTHDSP
jgi:hypothetical protein